MRPDETATMFRDLLAAEGIALDDDCASDVPSWRPVWDAFKRVAAVEASDPLFAYEEWQKVDHSIFQFETSATDVWPENMGDRPTDFGIDFLRAFGIGEHGDQMALSVGVWIPDAEDLQGLTELVQSDSPQPFEAELQQWIAEVEQTQAFTVAITKPASSVSFYFDSIG